MKRVHVPVTDSIAVGDGEPLLIVAGPCVIESKELCRTIAAHVAEVCMELGVNFVFKASFDKANRTSLDAFRGPGLEAGLEILRQVGEEFAVPLTSDIHDVSQVEQAGKVLDILQIPAFLCRQTDLLVASAETGRVVNLKKGQFMAPGGMGPAVDKITESGNSRVLLTERGSSFGYGNLVVDMRAFVQMRALGVPVVFDATHSVQQPGGLGHATGGDRRFAPVLARAACAAGIDALFVEVHPDPDNAKSDGPNCLPLSEIRDVLKTARDLHALCRP